MEQDIAVLDELKSLHSQLKAVQCLLDDELLFVSSKNKNLIHQKDVK